MTERIFLIDGRMATFICPNCKKSKTADVAKYAKIEKDASLKVKCPCGHSYSFSLERRSFYRKVSVELTGAYAYTNSEKHLIKGTLVILDISLGGIRFKVNNHPDFCVGEKVSLEFRLDDKNRTVIKKDGIIRYISEENIIGSEFYSEDPSAPYDKTLGFYLL